jgi:hypothetical protein
MKYGMGKISEMGVEAFVEASAQGLPLYRKFGFRTIDKVSTDTTIENPGFIWRKLEHDLGEEVIWWMWKPSGGPEAVYVEGETELPWERRG